VGQNIEISDVEFHKLTVDDCGALFTWRNRLFRAINHEAVVTVKDMFQSGLMKELIDNRLFPSTWITDYVIDGYGLVVEHERVSPIIYPFEWSFSMLKDAALTVLKINVITRKYGYQTKDCHGYNICFDNTDPLFVDLGSFERVDKHYKGWIAYEEFLRFYYYPLRIWSRGNYYFARRALMGCSLNDMLSSHSYFLYKVPLLRLLNFGVLEVLTFFGVKVRVVTLNPIKVISLLKKLRLNPIKVFFMFKERNLRGLTLHDFASLQIVNLSSLLKKVQKISVKRDKTIWGDYHSEYYDAAGKLKQNPRFERVASIIKTYEIKSVLELAGNQGLFSGLLIDQSDIEKVICTDSDESAVDIMYCRAKERKIKMVPAVLDFIFPMTNYFNNRPPYERFKADAVIALAVTHHLVLSQKLSLDYVFNILQMFTHRYIFIEFMPLGLYNGKNVPEVPSWYTFEWFKEAFEKHFNTLLVEKLEENRILFVGELIN
jgi:hypothetical protein